ncbi:MAG: hypothetical protein ABSD42_14525 [Candidatus Bathyarchaeia archaeon]|jgi:hypothetical protein
MKNRKLTYSHWSRDNIITDVSTVASRNAEETCQSNFKRVAGRLPTVKYECGAEILFLPDLRAMDHEVHEALHMQKLKAPAGAATEAEHVRDTLITQVLSKASKLENDGPHE